jgi:thiol-disulfide isomerase/thioredoxin
MKKLLLPLLLLAVILLFGCGKTTEGTAPDDATAPDAAVTYTAEAASEENETAAPVDAGQLDFATTDINGDPFTVEDLKDAKVVLVNFWEPWCGPCVGEIGDLARLYEEYKDQGFLIVGAYSTEGQDEDVKSIIEKNGVTYPVIKAGGNMSEFMTMYVPTTVFADGSGKIISAEPEIGAHSYDEWKALIEDYLAKS